jgi:hypothetical protein
VERVKWTDEHIERGFDQIDRRFDRVDADMRELRTEIRALRTDFSQLRLWLLGTMLTMALAIAGAYLH